ncbi:MAG: V-type ATPase subunit [Chloroflexota bacterium]|nr:V-type ATPase subunit [Chloroflexota bacterium]
MQEDVRSYAVAHARVRALYARLLTMEMWHELREAQDFDTLLDILAGTVYGPYLEIEEAKLTPRRAVYQLRGHLADAYIKVIRLSPRPGRQLLLQLWRLFEVDNLKAILRGIETGASWHQVQFTLFPTREETVLPAEEIFEAGSVPDAIEELSGTPYYAPLSHALERYQAEQNLFPLEVALDLDYYRALWSEVNQLKGLDHNHALRLVGGLIDVNNLMWAIRYRVYHNLSEEEIINYTLPFGYRVDDQDIRAIAAGADIASIVSRLYPEIENVEALLRRPQELERQLQHQLGRESHRTFIGYPFHIGIPVAYVLLNEQEVHDLTVLIEAKASQIPSEVYSSLLLVQPQPMESRPAIY